MNTDPINNFKNQALNYKNPRSDLNATAQIIDDLIQEIQTVIVSQVELDAERQNEVSKLLTILRRAKGLCAAGNLKKRLNLQAELETLVLIIKVAISALLHQAMIILAKELRYDAELIMQRLENYSLAFFVNNYRNFLRLSSVPVKVFIGLLIALPIYIGLPWSLISVLNDAGHTLVGDHIISRSQPKESDSTNYDDPTIYIEDFNEDVSLIVLSLVAGSTGSIISILARINEYDNKKVCREYQETVMPVFIGLFKPIIGGIFGILVFAIVASGLIPIFSLTNHEDMMRTDIKWLSVLAVTFVAGFSERLAKDIVEQTKKQLMPYQESNFIDSAEKTSSISNFSVANDIANSDRSNFAFKSKDSYSNLQIVPHGTVPSPIQNKATSLENSQNTTNLESKGY